MLFESQVNHCARLAFYVYIVPKERSVRLRKDLVLVLNLGNTEQSSIFSSSPHNHSLFVGLWIKFKGVQSFPGPYL